MPVELTGRQVVHEELAIPGQDDPVTVRAESDRPPDGAWVRHGEGAPVDVPDRQGMAWQMRGRQIAAVGAEAEDIELPIAPGLEAGDLLVVGDAADLDRAITESEGIASRGGVEGEHNDARGLGDDPAGGFQVGKGHA